MALFDAFIKKEKRTENIVNSLIQKYTTYSVMNLDSEFNEINNKINTYKGIVVFPEAMDYYPLDRPQQILRTFARKGFLCFFCINNNSDITLREIEPNLFIVNKQERLIPLLKNKKVSFLINYFIQYIFTKFIDNRVIWFDIIGRIDKYELYDNVAIKIYKEIMNEASLTTIKAEEYRKYFEGIRENVILLHDGVMPNDFKLDHKIGDDLKPYLCLNKKVIGYYGDVSKNIDFDLIKAIDATNKYAIVFIGKMTDNIDYEKDYGLHNTYGCYEKKYEELKNYIPYLDLVIFPLKVDDKHILYTKYLECTAMKKLVLSYRYEDLANLNLYNLKFFNNKEEAINLIDENLKTKDYDFEKNVDIIINNMSWDNILSKFIG